MKKKIQRIMMLFITVTLVISYLLMYLLAYTRIRNVAQENLRNEAAYFSEIVNRFGDEALTVLNGTDADLRITLVAPDGTVLYDTEENSAEMGNHADRPEIREALESGSGSSVRRSDTVGTDLFYCAERLEDGNVLRIARPVRSALYTAVQFLPVMILLLAGMLLIGVRYSRREADELVRPINELKVDEPLKNDTYEELKPLLVRIDEQNKAKDAVANMRKEFTANVSHELKTPLTSISGYAEIMKDGLVKEQDVPDFANRIYKESQRMITLVEDIIKLSKLDEGEVEEMEEDVNLYDLCRDICDSLQPYAEKHNVRMELKGSICHVTAVHRLVQEMITNIVDNAIRYNKPGGKVTIWAGGTIGGARVVVTDTGIGIPEDQLDRIFERFYRVDKSHSRETGGTGLGLSIAKHSAELCHARIHVSSKLGEGTRMEINFGESVPAVHKDLT